MLWRTIMNTNVMGGDEKAISKRATECRSGRRRVTPMPCARVERTETGACSTNERSAKAVHIKHPASIDVQTWELPRQFGCRLDSHSSGAAFVVVPVADRLIVTAVVFCPSMVP